MNSPLSNWFTVIQIFYGRQFNWASGPSITTLFSSNAIKVFLDNSLILYDIYADYWLCTCDSIFDAAIS